MRPPACTRSIVRLHWAPLFLVVCFLAGTVRALTVGNDPAAPGAVVDGYRAVMVVNETDTWTNTGGTPATITLTGFNVNIGAARGRVTPFVVKVNGDNDFTVLAVGRTRVAGADYTTAGAKSFAFADAAPAITLQPGEKLAPGYSDAAPDGSGNDGSVVPYVDGGDAIWLAGGLLSGDAAQVSAGGAPQAGPTTQVLTNLFRQYSFNVSFSSSVVTTGPSTLGNNPAGGGVVDGWRAIMVVNENDTYTNSSGGPEIVSVTQFHANAGAVTGRITPFIVRVNGDNNFTILAIGKTRVAGTDYTTTGVKNFAFADTVPVFTIEAGTKLAAGYSDANPDGTGNNAAVIPFVDGGDQIWLTGGGASSNAGRLVLNSAPQAGAGGQTLTNLTRQYSFNVVITTAPPGPLAPVNITLAALDLFPETPAGTAVGPLTTADPNPEDTHTYALVNDAGGRFTLAGSTLMTAAVLGPVGSPHTIRVRSSDQGGLAFEKDITLSVKEPHAPLDIVTTAQRIGRATPVNASLGRFTTVDPDAADGHAYALVAGAGDTNNALFAIAGEELRLAGSVPAGAAALGLRVRSTDRAGLAVEKAFTLPVIETGVRINEYLATNDTSIRDEDGSAEDWIELHNPLATAVDLTGWRLTDDPENPALWTFPARTLPAGGYLVVFASGKNRTPASGNLHTGFRLDGSSGEYLALVRPDGTVADFHTAQEQFTDLAFGWENAGTGQGYLTPTPNAPNSSVFPFGLNEVDFSVKRGFYTTAQSLTLTAAVPASVIRYTTNGSKPGAANGTVYTGPISLTPDTTATTRGTRRIRAVAIQPAAAASRVATHTYLFINGIAAPATDGVVGQTNSNNPTQTNAIRANATYAPLLKDALTSLSAVSVINPAGNPGTSESETSIEFFHPSGDEPGFQIDCGIQAVGNASLASPKNNFRLYMRSEYGKPELNHNIFRNHPHVEFHTPAESFDRIALRSGSHDSFHWMAETGNPPMAGVRGDALYLRAVMMDDFHLSMGHIAPHNRFVQLWLNGAYHGLYHWREYPNDDFQASYRPGGSESYEFTNGANPGENGSANWQAQWNQMRTAVTQGYTQAARWINLPQLADFIVLNFWAGNAWDWNPNQNWMAGGPNGPDRGGWIFFSYDNDVIWNDPNANLTIPSAPNYVNNPRQGVMPPDGLAVTTATGDVTLMDHADFRVLFRDRLYRACFHNGVLTAARAQTILDRRVNEISLAMVAETARWQPGTATALPWDRNGEWTTEVNRIRNGFMTTRCATILGQVRARGWYPIEAPEFAQHGGAVPAGYVPPVTSASPGTQVYVTTDGSDPRLQGGAINPAALLISPPPPEFVVNGPVLVRMRARRTTDGEWSALNEAAFFTQGTVPADATNIAITEIHYHPAAATPPPGNAEFLEVMNTGNAPVDLSGCWFLRGIDFVFPAASVLAPGQRLVVSEEQFLNGTNLANGGERLTLMQPGGAVIRDFAYDDDLPWPSSPDGTGASLVLAAPGADHTTDAWHSDGLHWRASLAPGGNPGASDAAGYAAWKTGYNITTDSDDGDGDGLDAVLEYFTGSDPAMPSPNFLPVMEWTATGPVLKVRLGSGVEAAFAVEHSPDLQAWTPSPSTTVAREPVPGGGELISLLLPSAPPRSYWRVRVSTPG